MNILLVNLTKMVGDSGGMAKVTCNFANQMKKRGHQVALVYSDVQVMYRRVISIIRLISKFLFTIFVTIRDNLSLIHGT